MNAADHFGGGNHVVHLPAVGGADVHVFDVTQNVAGVLEVARHRHDVLIVDAALDHHVDFDRCEADGRSKVDAFQHPRDGKIDVVHRFENFIVEGIETHGNAL